MKRRLFVGMLLITLLGLGTGVIWIRTGQAKRVKFNIKDLPDHGLSIVGPTFPTFESDIAKLKEGKSNKQRAKIDAFKSFSGIIANSGNHDVVAYTIKWELTRADGKVTTSYSNYTAPGGLMGDKMPAPDQSDVYLGRKIRRNSKRIISFDSSVDDENSPRSISLSPSDASQAARINQALQSGDDTEIVNAINDQMADATDVTMTLDSAVFDDGTFVGPDSAKSFDTLRAEIAAKHDLLLSIVKGLRAHKEPDEILDHIQLVSDALNSKQVAPSSSNAAKYSYRYFSLIYRIEILKVRSSIGDAKQTLGTALDPLRRPWPKLTKVQ